MTSTTDMPTPREIIIETMAIEVEAAHEKHVVAYSINRVKTYGWKLPAGSTGQESEAKSMAACIQASDAFDELLRKQLQEAFDYGQAAGQASAAQCLHQIQEPPTKTEALAHYSQQAILAMGEAGAAAPVQAAVDSPMAVTLNARLQSEAALEVAMARILKADPGHSISVTSEAKALVAVRAALFAQAMPAAVAVPDEREAFEKWARFFGTWDLERDDDPSFSTTGYKDITVTVAWMAWQARPALAATPAADAPLHAEMLSALQAVAMDAVGVGGGENTIGNAARAKVDAVLVKLGVPWADRGAAAAAPVVLPEPLAFYDGNKWYADEAAAICACADLPKLQKVYTEQQVRALLAGVSAPAAQAVGRDLQSVVSAAAEKLDAAKRCHPNAIETLIDEALEILDGDREPPAQADERDTQWLQPADMAALERFAETTEDDQSFDIGKEAVARLAHFGCIQNQGFGRYCITAFGSYVLNDWSLARDLPFKMQAERDAAHRAAIAAQAAQQGGAA